MKRYCICKCTYPSSCRKRTVKSMLSLICAPPDYYSTISSGVQKGKGWRNKYGYCKILTKVQNHLAHAHTAEQVNETETTSIITGSVIPKKKTPWIGAACIAQRWTGGTKKETERMKSNRRWKCRCWWAGESLNRVKSFFFFSMWGHFAVKDQVLSSARQVLRYQHYGLKSCV